MDKISNNSACVIGVITLIAVIPRYIQLPKSLELLFHDMIGQLLLLILAITVGSYNFTCGVLLVILFLSIMLQSKTIKYSGDEGFINYEEGDDKDMELNENFDTTKKTKKSVDTQDDEEVKVEEVEEVEEEPTPKSTKNTKMKKDNSSVDDLKQELRDSQKKIKDLEAKMKKTTSTPSKSNKNMKQKDETETEPEMEMEMETEATSAPTVEGFECGCNNDNRRTKFVKYKEAEGLIETFEVQPTQKPQVENDCYDLAGCKYQNGYTPFNDTLHGPPVDSCHAYRNANINATGTLFYPLN